jgi:hypothetical protein
MTANLVPTITAGMRSFSGGVLVGVIACELYHKDLTIVNETIFAQRGEYDG